MNTQRRILAILMVAVVIAAFFSCSDDDEDAGSNPVIPTEGELTDEQYLFADLYLQPNVMKTADISLTSTLFLLMTITSPSTISGMPDMAASREMVQVIPTVTDTPAISPEGWYVFDFRSVAYYQDEDFPYPNFDSVISTGLDSVQLSAEGVPIEWTTGASYDMIEYRYRTNWIGSNGMNGECYHKVTLSPSTESLTKLIANMTIADFESDPLMDDGGYCLVNKHTTAEAADFEIEFSMDLFNFGYCVGGGSVSGRTIIDLDCTSSAESKDKGFEGVWDFEGDFDSLFVMPHRITHGATFWLAADTCEM